MTALCRALALAGGLLLATPPARGADPFGGSGAARPEPERAQRVQAEEAAAARRAAFDDARGVDGVYGRFDGELSLSLGAGAELTLAPTNPRLLGSVALRYFSLVGVYATYREGLDAADPGARGLSAGVLFEPLFLLRWTEAATTRSAFWDLTLDSLGVSVGAHLGQPRDGSFFERRGFEAGLGGGVPLLAWAEGAWLRARGNMRWLEDGTTEPVIWLTLEWQSFFETSLGPALRP